ncbi:MAG: hypothetical protein COB36_11430 [Alphaproteobacteria bacterium]|nr:MAG: hypothetical protein COB36_11430 [Alphaproteobacteria bacterium]
MSKTLCPAGCGKKFTTKEFSEKHADAAHGKDWRIPKQKGWATPYGFIDFGNPVTYEYALKASKEMADSFKELRESQ